MAFIVPALEQFAVPRYHFGACKVPLNISDPGGAPSSGVVYLRGAITRDPAGHPPIVPPGNLMHIFTLPPGMRPPEDRWLTCQLTTYMSMCNGAPTLCIVRRNGAVHVETRSINSDGAIYFDGLSFFAAGRQSPPPGTRTKPSRKPRGR